MKNWKKILAAATAGVICAVGAPLAGLQNALPNMEITASAEEYGDLAYVFLEDGSIEITDCDTSVTSVDIPAEIDGIAVTSIGDWAFWNCTSLASITIPDSVTSIGSEAFEDCTSLTSITIPDSVISIGGGAFDNTALLNNQNGVKYADTWAVDCDSDVTTAEIKAGTKGIADYAFSYCFNLTEVVIPESVVSIGNGAFGDPNTHTGDDGSNGLPFLKSVEIQGNGLKYIGENAFAGDGSLTMIDLPDSVEYIGSEAFAYTSILKIDLPTSLNAIDDAVFFGTAVHSMIVPECINSIGYSNGCNLRAIVIPNTLKSLSSWAFNNYWSGSMWGEKGLSDLYYLGTEEEWNDVEIYSYSWDSDEKVEAELLTDAVIHFNCRMVTSGALTYCLCEDEAVVFSCDTAATSITIPSAFEGLPVTKIEADAFKLCKNLKTISVPDSVQKIGDSAFDYCSSLTSISFPKDIELPEVINDEYMDINGVEDLFDGCDVLKEITFDDNDSNYLIYDGAIYDKNSKALLFCPTSKNTLKILPEASSIERAALEDCKEIKTLDIPNTVTRIGSYAMYDAGLTEISIPDSVTEIDQYAFALNSNLRKVELPNALNKICNNTFGGCTSLTSIEIPNSVTIIDWEAFWNCTSLSRIVIPKSVTEINYHAFCYYPDYPNSWDTEIIPNIVIYGYRDSYAEKYASDQGISFVSIKDTSASDTNTQTTPTKPTTEVLESGDLDGDGKITINDAYNALLAYSRISAGLDSGLTDAQIAAADVDGDGKVTIKDAYKILLYYATKSAGGTPSWN